MEVAVAGQVQGVDKGQRRARALGLGDGHRPVQRDHGRTGLREEGVVERHDRRPVDRVLGLQLRDRGLHGVGAAGARGERAVEQGAAFGDPVVVPARRGPARRAARARRRRSGRRDGSRAAA